MQNTDQLPLLNSRMYLVEKKLEYLTTLIVTWTRLNTIANQNNFEVIVSDNEYNECEDNEDNERESDTMKREAVAVNIQDDKRYWYMRRII
jgi:hypothetical protein